MSFATLGLTLFIIVCGSAAVILLNRAALAGPVRSGRGVCGKCRYATEGLTNFTCPECGSDFRDVGIVAAPSRLKMPLIVILLAGAILLVPCCVLGYLMTASAPMRPVPARAVTPPPTSAPPANSAPSAQTWYYHLNSGSASTRPSPDTHVEATAPGVD